MRSIRVVFATACAFAAGLSGVLCAAQAALQAPGSYPTKIVPQATENASPFAVNAPASQTINAIGFLNQEAMSPQDQRAVSDAFPAIQSKATLAGFNVREGQWSYQQIACPVLPEHLLLLYSRNQGVGDLSMFSVILPRDGKGSVNVLPILRRSFSLYTPVSVNPVTIATFNRVRNRDTIAQKPDWLLTGLCYAALAGVHVKLTWPDQTSNGALPALTPLLQVDGGESIVRFVDLEMPQMPKQWALTFDQNGTLLKVEVSMFPLQPRIIP